MKQDYLQMRVLELAPQVYASGQLFESDLQLLARQGVRSIVITRPDKESEGQVVYVHIRAMNQASLAKFEQVIDQFFYKRVQTNDVLSYEKEMVIRSVTSSTISNSRIFSPSPVVSNLWDEIL